MRVLGIDGLYPLGKGKKQSVLIAVDLGSGQPVAIGHVNEYDLGINGKANPCAIKCKTCNICNKNSSKIPIFRLFSAKFSAVSPLRDM